MSKAGMNKSERGLYVHVPFCIWKCDYCDFISKVKSEDEVSKYLTGLYNELKFYQKAWGENLIFDTVYIGGGTPTSLSIEELEELFGLIFGHIRTANKPEITLEANPCTLDKSKLELIKNYVNRISLGLQSSHEHLLLMLGRRHTYLDFLRSYELASRYFDNINVDLIYGIPGETLDDLEKDVMNILEVVPSHVSLYCLTLENGTKLNYHIQNNLIKDLPDDSLQSDMYYKAREILLNEGYLHYEISNFSLPGRCSAHNINYWKRGNYLGMGPGAHSFWNNKRWKNSDDLDEYYLKSKRSKNEKSNWLQEEIEEIAFNDAISEEFFLGLRLTEGINLEKLGEKFDLDIINYYYNEICKLEEKELLRKTTNTIKLTTKGYMLANKVFIEFLESLDK